MPPLTATRDEIRNLDATETVLVNGWRHALENGQTARFVAALIATAVGYEPRLGLPMDVCDRTGCDLLVDETARDDQGRLYCSAGHQDADDADAYDTRAVRGYRPGHRSLDPDDLEWTS